MFTKIVKSWIYHLPWVTDQHFDKLAQDDSLFIGPLDQLSLSFERHFLVDLTNFVYLFKDTVDGRNLAITTWDV